MLVYSTHVLHEPRQLGVVLRKLRAPRLGEGGRGPAAALQGPPQLRRDRVVEAPINNFHHVQLGSDPGVVDAAAVSSQMRVVQHAVHVARVDELTQVRVQLWIVCLTGA